MKKINLVLLLFIIGNTAVDAQEVYFFTGKNYTTYDLKDQGQSTNTFTKKGEGSSYEIGLSIPIPVTRLTFDNPLNYSVGLTLNQYNAEAGNITTIYDWKTEYVGIQNSINYSVVKSNHIDLTINGGLNFSTMISGNQKINNSKFDLFDYKEFTGVVFTPSLGLRTKCNLSEYGYLSLGYNYSGSFNLTNDTQKKLTFRTHQVLFGIHFELY
jgi:hypothetical protein